MWSGAESGQWLVTLRLRAERKAAGGPATAASREGAVESGHSKGGWRPAGRGVVRGQSQGCSWRGVESGVWLVTLQKDAIKQWQPFVISYIPK